MNKMSSLGHRLTLHLLYLDHSWTGHRTKREKKFTGDVLLTSTVFLLLLVLKDLLPKVNGIRLLSIAVPQFAVNQSNGTTLKCNYDLENDVLYSLKWYFNGTEFKSYTRNGNGKYELQLYPVPGIHLSNTTMEKANVVHLRQIDERSEGFYKCELLADSHFQTVQLESFMKVIVAPAHQPIIRRDKNSSWYAIGDVLNATCSGDHWKGEQISSRLLWYINEEKAPDDYVIRHDETLTTLFFEIQDYHLRSHKKKQKKKKKKQTKTKSQTNKEKMRQLKSGPSSSHFKTMDIECRTVAFLEEKITSKKDDDDQVPWQNEDEDEDEDEVGVAENEEKVIEESEERDDEEEEDEEKKEPGKGKVIAESLSFSPVISGQKNVYRLGETVDINCSFPFRSEHNTHLEWFVSHKKTCPHRLVHYPDGTLGISLRIFPCHLVHGDQLTLSCQATRFVGSKRSPFTRRRGGGGGPLTLDLSSPLSSSSSLMLSASSSSPGHDNHRAKSHYKFEIRNGTLLILLIYLSL